MPGPFIPPLDPVAGTTLLREELERLRKALDDTRSEADKAKLKVKTAARVRLSAKDRAAKDREDRLIWEQLAAEAEQANLRLAAELRGLQDKAAVSAAKETEALQERAEIAAGQLEIDEAANEPSTTNSCVTGAGKPTAKPCDMPLALTRPGESHGYRGMADSKRPS